MAIKVIFFDLGDTLVTAQRQWLPEAKPLLQSLRQPGLRLGIISNTTGLNTRAKILNLLPNDFDLSIFEASLTLFSSEVKIDKPQKAIFLAAVERTGGPASECLYCSESIVETLMAQECGMRSIRVQTSPNSDLGLLQKTLQKFQALVV
jgi:FMN phosphatase YigB (HAD superfamily)